METGKAFNQKHKPYPLRLVAIPRITGRSPCVAQAYAASNSIVSDVLPLIVPVIILKILDPAFRTSVPGVGLNHMHSSRKQQHMIVVS